jgi:hypothetical protein
LTLFGTAPLCQLSAITILSIPMSKRLIYKHYGLNSSRFL